MQYLIQACLLAWLITCPDLFAEAENFKYSELHMRNLDEMTSEVKARVYKAEQALNTTAGKSRQQRESAAIQAHRNTLKFIFARPNKDNMASKLVPFVRPKLDDLNAFEDTLASLADEAIRTIENKRLSPTYRGTAIFILENIMGEVRPELGGNKDFWVMLTKIRDAKIKVSDKVKNERKLRSMYKTKSPSFIASTILKAEKEKQKKRAALKDKAEAAEEDRR